MDVSSARGAVDKNGTASRAIPDRADGFIEPGALARFAGPAITAAAYYAGAIAAFLIGTYSDTIFAPFWPPNTILFAALLLAPMRRWPLYLAAVIPAHVLAELWVAMPPLQMLVAYVTNCLFAVPAAFLLRRLALGPPWFGSVRSLVAYVAIAAVIVPAFAALGGGLVPVLGGEPASGYLAYVAMWFAGNALAALTLGPAILCWFEVSPDQRLTPARTVEAVLLGAALVVTSVTSFRLAAEASESGLTPMLLILPLPVMLWMAYRFGSRGASSAVLVFAAIAIANAIDGPSVFLADSVVETVTALQLFLAAVALPKLFIGSAIDQLRRAERALSRLTLSQFRAEDEERRRIARALHEGAAQTLAAAAILADPTAAGKGPVGGIGDLIRRSIEEVRSLSSQLHPPLLDELGLTSALRDLVRERFPGGEGRHVNLSIDRDGLGLSPEAALNLFRLAEESLDRAGEADAPPIEISVGRRGKADSGVIEMVIERALARAAAGEMEGAPGELVRIEARLRAIGGTLSCEMRGSRLLIRATVPAST